MNKLSIFFILIVFGCSNMPSDLHDLELTQQYAPEALNAIGNYLSKELTRDIAAHETISVDVQLDRLTERQKYLSEICFGLLACPNSQFVFEQIIGLRVLSYTPESMVVLVCSQRVLYGIQYFPNLVNTISNDFRRVYIIINEDSNWRVGFQSVDYIEPEERVWASTHYYTEEEIAYQETYLSRLSEPYTRKECAYSPFRNYSMRVVAKADISEYHQYIIASSIINFLLPSEQRPEE